MGAVQRAGMQRERSAAGGEKREERKAGEGDFSLHEVMDDGFSQSES